MKLDIKKIRKAYEVISQDSYIDIIGSAMKVHRYRKDYVINAQKEFQTSRIAILGAGSLQYLAIILDYILLMNDIDAEILIGTYNGLELDVYDEQSDYSRFKPEVTIVITQHNDIKEWPAMFEEVETVDKYVNQYTKHYQKLWECINRDNQSIIFQTNLVLPIERPLGNLESNYSWSISSYLKKINQSLVDQHPEYVLIIDLEYLASFFGKERWFDYANFYNNKTLCAYECLPRVAEIIGKNIGAFHGKMKKCLVLDLDNTLWGGIVGDVGDANILLDPNDPVGEAYIAFQKYVLRLKKRGIIIAVCSKNEDQTAKAPFLNNRNMVLKLEDISCFVANWNDKVKNIILIADKLNISLDSIVFFDDNEVERAYVKEALADVKVIEVPEDPAQYILALDKAMVFEWNEITREDISRTDTFRLSSLPNFDVGDKYEDFLNDLAMKGYIGEAKKDTMARIVQLFNKTNQFNTVRYRTNQAEIINLCQSEDSAVLFFKLADKYSDYGIISAAILVFEENVCWINAWCMSCRVFRRGVEDEMLNEFVSLAKVKNCGYLHVKYTENNKNKLVKDILINKGFEECGNYLLHNVNELQFDTHIEMEE